MKIATVIRPALLLLDDNPAILEMLREILAANYTVVAALSTGTAVLDQVSSLNPDVLISDISLGDISGFKVATHLRDLGDSTKIVFLSVHEDVDFVDAAFDLGASGYVFKSRIYEDLSKAIDVVLRGGRFISPGSVFPSQSSR
jgi:DNA-binding NarL/FixJ family response regulator